LDSAEQPARLDQDAFCLQAMLLWCSWSHWGQMGERGPVHFPVACSPEFVLFAVIFLGQFATRNTSSLMSVQKRSILVDGCG